MAATPFDVDDWLDEHWDPEIGVGEWWRRLADARLAHPTLPEPWGRGWCRRDVAGLADAMVRHRVLGPPSGMGIVLVAPTLLAHASPSLQEALMPPILDGRHGWCQLFSEPAAGSDLAGLQTRAERDGDEWVVTGQKVWTSLGQWADYGILMARTDPGASKHRGITFFAFPMRQHGVDVRPLREMTGRAMFNEVFIDEARVPHDHVIGEVGGGWRVANTTLSVERSGIGGERVAAPCAALPGSLAGHLDQPVASFAGVPETIGEIRIDREMLDLLVAAARARDRLGDATVRQDLAHLHSMLEISDWHLGRMKAGGAATGAEGNMAKLRNSDLTRLARDLGCRVLGAEATASDSPGATAATIQDLTVFSPAPSIYGGTDQVQRNIIGERVLGLPKEPGPPSDTPYRALPRNTTPAR